MRHFRTFRLTTVGRYALPLLVAGALVAAMGCSSQARTRIMHFFFEYPPPGGPDTAPTAPAAPVSDEPAVRIESAERFASRHPPFIERKCQDCHVRGMGQSPRPDFMAACRKCHEPLFAYHRFGHGPAVAGDCRFCHLMHVSQNKALLKAPQTKMCTSCHPAQQSEEALTSFHRGIEAVRCTACHDPHFADNQLLLKSEEVRQKVKAALHQERPDRTGA